MNISLRNPALLAAMIGAVLATSMIAPASARQPPGSQHDQRHENHSDSKKKAGKHKADKHKNEKADKQAGRNQHAAAKSRDVAQRNAREGHRQADRNRISERDLRNRIEQQRSRVQANVQYQQRARELEHQRALQLQQANHNAQYSYQQAYYQRLNAQQAKLNQQRYDYNSNPYISSPNTYRYSFGGRDYTTNQYGADLLRQAVNRGYQEGLRAGPADRSDRSRSDYRNSYAYQDASYGYDNYYVDRQQYNHYFREGFQRGYEDGYGSRSQYDNYNSSYFGDYNIGTATILQTVLSTILNLQSTNP